MTFPSFTSSSKKGTGAFALRLAAFIVLILVAQVLVSYWTEASFPELSRVDRYLEARVDIIYLGDSVLHYHARDDRTRQGIPEFLQDLLPAHSLGAVDHPAYHLGLYRLFCGYLRRSGSPPSVVIIPITLRSFSAAWQRRPEYKFPNESVILEYRTRHYDSRPLRALLHPLIVFKAFDLRPVPSSAKSAIATSSVGVGDGEDVPTKRREDVSDTDVARWLTSAYMYSLNATHPFVQDMVAIVKMFRGSRTRLLFYVTPIDHETGTRIVGEAFSGRVREHVAFFFGLSAAHDFFLSDLSLSLGTDAFGWRGDSRIPNEHLAEAGRRYVAERVADSVKHLLRDSGTEESAIGRR